MLNFSIRYEESTGIQKIKLSGKLCKSSAQNLIHKISESQQDDKQYLRLYEMHEIDVDIPIQEFGCILSLAWEKLQKTSVRHKVAMLSEDSYIRDLLNIFKVQSRNFPSHVVEIFCQEKAARDWLAEV